MMKPTNRKPETDMGKRFDKNYTKTMNMASIPNKYLNEVDAPLNEKEQSLKKKIFSLDKMEALVHADPKLSAVYVDMAEDGKEKYGYHWNETIMNIIFNDYILNSPKYLQKYKNVRGKKKKRRDSTGLNQLKQSLGIDTDKEKADKKKEKTDESWSENGKPQADSKIDNAEVVAEGEINNPDYTHYIVDVKTRKIESGWENKNDALERKDDINSPDVRVYSKQYLQSKGLNPEDDNNWAGLNETTSAGGAGGANGFTGYATPRAWSKSGKPQKREIWKGGRRIQESNYLTNPKAFMEYVNMLNEDIDVDEKKLNKVLNKYQEITKENRKPTSKEKQDFFDDYSKFLDDFVGKNLDMEDTKALKEKDMNNKNMVEHHLDTKQEKIDFICQHLNNPNMRMSLEKLSDQQVDMLYRKLENKLGLNETTQSMIDQPSDSMANKANPTGDQGSIGGIQVNEDHLFTSKERIDYICKVIESYPDLFSIDNKVARQALESASDEEVENKYFEIESILKSNGIDPHTIEIETELDEMKKLTKTLKNIGEERKPSALVLRDRVGKDNEKNFKSDMTHSGTKDVIDTQKELEYNKQQTEVKDPKKLGQDIEKESLKKTGGEALKNVGDSSNEKGDEIPKRNYTKEEAEEVNLMRRDVADYDFDNEPDQRFEDRMKKDMGEEKYELRQKRKEYRKDRPMYGKDKQPVKDMKENYETKVSKLNEDVAVTGKFKNLLGKNVIVDFYLSETKQVNKIDENWFKLDFGGLGNSYSKNFKLNETVCDIINENHYYIDTESKQVYVVEGKQNLTEGKQLDSNDKPEKNIMSESAIAKMNKLSGYNPGDYTKTSGVKKNRGF